MSSVEWKECTLLDLCELKAGSGFKREFQGSLDGDLPFIKVSDMNNAGNEFAIRTSSNWVSLAVAKKLKARPLPTGTSVFAKIGEALRKNRVRMLTMETIVDNNMMGAVPRRETVLPAFLFYLLDNFDIASTSNGTALPYLTVTVLGAVRFKVPEIEAQARIVSILSAYDDLIENSTRRIAILEEMARRIFEEWFVHFRAPGCENLSLVESPIGPVPEGWEVVVLSDFAETQYGYTTSATHRSGGPRFLRGMDINKTSYIDWSAVPYCEEAPIDQQKFVLEKGDILVIRMADPGKIGIVERNIEAVFASYLVRLRFDHRELPPNYLFHLLSDARYQSYVTGASNGTTRKSIPAPVMVSFQFAKPPKPILLEFDRLVSPLRNMLSNLVQQNQNLRAQRDLLLPKLISGEIDVSEVEQHLEAAE